MKDKASNDESGVIKVTDYLSIIDPILEKRQLDQDGIISIK